MKMAPGRTSTFVKMTPNSRVPDVPHLYPNHDGSGSKLQIVIETSHQTFSTKAVPLVVWNQSLTSTGSLPGQVLRAG